jgi:hypothetical protein
VGDDKGRRAEQRRSAPAPGGLERVAADDDRAEVVDARVEKRAAFLGHAAEAGAAGERTGGQPVVQRVDLVVRARDEAVEGHGEAEAHVGHVA